MTYLCAGQTLLRHAGYQDRSSWLVGCSRLASATNAKFVACEQASPEGAAMQGCPLRLPAAIGKRTKED